MRSPSAPSAAYPTTPITARSQHREKYQGMLVMHQVGVAVCEFLGAPARTAATHDFAGGGVQRGCVRSSAWTCVFIIDREHHGVHRRIEVEPDHIDHLLSKSGARHYLLLGPTVHSAGDRRGTTLPGTVALAKAVVTMYPS